MQMVVPLLVAYVIHRRVPGWRFFRATVFLPAVYATVVIGILTATVLQLDGPLNSALGAVGLGSLRHEWLGSATTSIPIILLVVDLDELRLQRPALPGRHERDRPHARGSRQDRRRWADARASPRHRPEPPARDGDRARRQHDHGLRLHVHLHLHDHERRPRLRHVRLRVLHLQPGVHEPEHGLRSSDRRVPRRHRARHRHRSRSGR